MSELLILGRQFQRCHRAPESTRHHDGRGLAGPVVANHEAFNVPLRATQTKAHLSNLDVVTVMRNGCSRGACGAPRLVLASQGAAGLSCDEKKSK